jgi:FMN-dependent oxidoreductase (nitrilotriacetate monooxygenase family)
MPRQMHLAVFVLGTGNHVAGWRYPGANATFQNLGQLQEIARIAERGCFDFLFFGDGPVVKPNMHPSYMVRPDPILILSALAATTSHIGLGGTASTTYNQPFSVARAFATLDHLSGGRAAWNAVTTATAEAALNFGRVHPAHDERYAIAEEFVDVVTGLWDCWDDDAIVADRATGQFLDWSKIRPLDHNGKYFTVKGPLNVGRAPQGRPIVIQAGGSDRGQELAARTADVVFSVVQDFDEAKAAYAGFKARLAKYGRAASDVTVLPGVMPIVGATEAEARQKLNRLQSYVDDGSGIGMLSNRLGVDLSGYPLDGPVPDVALPDTSHAFARALISKARRESMSLRDLYNLTMAARGHMVVCGTPGAIADTLEMWFQDGAADGFNIMPPYYPETFVEFVDLVVPELQRRGLYRTAYPGPMLRDTLGLPRPAVRKS